MKKTVFIFIVLFSAVTHAQTVLHSGNDTAQHHSGIHVTVMNPNGKRAIDYKGNSLHTDSVANAVKLNVTNFFRGDYEVYFEHRFSDSWSAEVAGGITYIDYMYEFFWNNGQYLAGLNGESRNSKFYSGLAWGAQFRWYPSKYETAITGFYLAPAISYRQYKMDYFVYTGLMSEPHPLNRTFTDYKIQFGWQGADPYNRVFWEWYVSAGLRHMIGDYIETRNYVEEFVHDDYFGPIVGGGVKIGFAL